MGIDGKPVPRAESQDQQCSLGHDSGTASSQSRPQSLSNSQTSHISSATDQAVTPPASDTRGFLNRADASAILKQRYATARLVQATSDADSHNNNQLRHLSAVAAAQDKLGPEPGGHSRKRMADGEVKHCRVGSMSPVKAHSRTTSAVSIASTTGSTIGELSAELKTRLSYAMVKVNHGWQGRSLDEVESLVSQAASPTSSTSTAHCRNGASASPRLPISAPSSQTFFANKPPLLRRSSNSPPLSSYHKTTLAPPATIQPSTPMSAPRSNPRRNSNPRYTPTMLSHSHSHSHSATSSARSTPVHNGFSRTQSCNVEPMIYSPHKNVREQDAIETLMFMSSPGNSANLKHSFSPSGSPGPYPNVPPGRNMGDRYALSSCGSRHGLPSNRPSSTKKAELVKSYGVPPSHSPMDVDPPQQYCTPNRAGVKRHTPGHHHRGALSLPSGLGLGSNVSRKVLRDEDIERMLDQAGAELRDSSDDEEIQLPPRRNGLARVMDG